MKKLASIILLVVLACTPGLDSGTVKYKGRTSAMWSTYYIHVGKTMVPQFIYYPARWYITVCNAERCDDWYVNEQYWLEIKEGQEVTR